MNQKIFYVCTAGEHPDRHICGVFDDRESVERFCKEFKCRIEEWGLNPPTVELIGWREAFRKKVQDQAHPAKFPTSPRQMMIVKVKPQLASELNAKWHSRLPKIPWSNIVRNRYYICYAAVFDQQYFAVGIWSSPVNRNFDLDTVLELRRFAVSPDAPKYTATWMLGKMARLLKNDLPTIKRLISYQDANVHTGTIYKAANWFAAGYTKLKPWNNKSRKRSGLQSTADKIRWEYFL